MSFVEKDDIKQVGFYQYTAKSITI